jgi:hypothetical protein
VELADKSGLSVFGVLSAGVSVVDISVRLSRLSETELRIDSIEPDTSRDVDAGVSTAGKSVRLSSALDTELRILSIVAEGSPSTSGEVSVVSVLVEVKIISMEPVISGVLTAGRSLVDVRLATTSERELKIVSSEADASSVLNAGVSIVSGGVRLPTTSEKEVKLVSMKPEMSGVAAGMSPVVLRLAIISEREL